MSTPSLMSSDDCTRMEMDTSVSLSGSGSGLSKAGQACISCRKQKRKCDKILPVCSLCSRMGRRCDYTDTPAAPTAEDLAVLQARLADLERRLSAANAHANAANTSGIGNSSNGGSSSSSGSSPAFTGNVVVGPPSLSTSAATATADIDGSNSSSRPSANSRPAGNGGSSFWPPAETPIIMIPSNFPSAIFLDMDCFKWAGMHIPRPNVPVPAEVYAMLSTTNGIQDSVAMYFETIHPWWPIISRKRMSIGTSLWEGGPDLAMLFLAMRLVTVGGVSASGFGTGASLPPAEDPLYLASKRFLGQLEMGGCLSLCHLQAMILVAVYEMGHGIYPAAWMSVAACARYIEIIGIPSFKESSAVLGSVTTWTEMEERRRCWWAVYVLDRVICLGNKKRCCLPEPDDHFVLPVDDAAWDAGDPARSLQYGVRTTELGVPQAPFARLVQGAVLISNILTHCRDRIDGFRKGGKIIESEAAEKGAGNIQRLNELVQAVDEYTQITSEELAQSVLVNNNNSPDSAAATTTGSPGQHKHPQKYGYFSRLPPRCLATSAQILLFDAYACPENLCDGPSPLGSDSFPPKSPAELNIQVTAVEGLRSSSLSMRDLSLEILENVMLPSEQRKISFLCLDGLYCAVATLHWLFKEGGDERIGAALGDVRNCLGRLAMRWGVGGVYGDMMGFHDVTVAMALRNGFS